MSHKSFFSRVRKWAVVHVNLRKSIVLVAVHHFLLMNAAIQQNKVTMVNCTNHVVHMEEHVVGH